MLSTQGFFLILAIVIGGIRVAYGPFDSINEVGELSKSVSMVLVEN